MKKQKPNIRLIYKKFGEELPHISRLQHPLIDAPITLGIRYDNRVLTLYEDNRDGRGRLTTFPYRSMLLFSSFIRHQVSLHPRSHGYLPVTFTEEE